jgi:hypothetical protein
MPTDVAAAVELALPADLALRAHTAQPCRHPPADTYQDYIILPGHINFGAEQVDTSTQARGYPRGGASRARPLSAPVLCAAPRETRRARTVARAPPPPLLPSPPARCLSSLSRRWRQPLPLPLSLPLPLAPNLTQELDFVSGELQSKEEEQRLERDRAEVQPGLTLTLTLTLALVLALSPTPSH